MRNESNLFIDCISGSAYGLACPKSKQKLLSFGVPINFVSTSRVGLLRECELDGFKPSSSKGQRDVAAEGSGGRGFRVYGRHRRTRFTLQRFTLHDFIPTSVLSSSVRRPRQG